VRPIRVLVVDDSVVVRRLVSDALSADPAMEVVATAANGRIALAKLGDARPDIVTLDIEMPEMDGLETMAELRRRQPRLPVVMFSTLTERGAAATLDALSLGARDYVTKPTNSGSLTESIRRVQQDLTPKLKALCPGLGSSAAAVSRPARTAGATVATPGPARPLAPIDVVAIGISTGGPKALAELLPALPGDLPVPVLIVQHMPPVFTRQLAERLDARSALGVSEAAGGDQLRPGAAYIAPGGHHLVVHKAPGGVLQLRTNEDPPENSCRPAVDVLFRSVAAAYGSRSLAAVMTGMGHDGLLGAQEIAGSGGFVLAQDEASSVVWGMPGAVARAGLADRVLPLSDLAAEIARRAAHGRTGRAPIAMGAR
jgi:two-component system chemotaxis response regulator CheB